jgi:hypothetical protein
MARLFITEREQDFISDLTKEVMRDVNGQVIYYYPVCEQKTVAPGVYNEDMNKIFDQPLEIDAFVTPIKGETKINEFGIDQGYEIDAYAQYRDLVDTGVNPTTGDFFQYGDVIYEITNVNIMRNIYGQAEHIDGIVMHGIKAREGIFNTKLRGPTMRHYTDPDAVQTTFVQDRGYVANRLGKTGDKREMYDRGLVDRPLSGPQEVSPSGDETGAGSSFYDSEDDAYQK